MAERADFYVLEGSDARERLRFACRVIAKAVDADMRVLVWCSDAAELAAFDPDHHDIRARFAQPQHRVPELHLLEPVVEKHADLAHGTPFAVSCLTGCRPPSKSLSYSEIACFTKTHVSR